ncbi:MAG: ABC transporter permease, partial [Lachnospiraceae bacterium]|nr:ABC transporter permease [Lachnospiraceae bacterium]
FTDESGEVIEENVERQKNPNYITGIKREIYEFLNDFLPGSQMLQLANQEIDVSKSGVKLPAYSLLIVVSTTACGVFFFRRKNLN